jgi:hypothetical protein
MRPAKSSVPSGDLRHLEPYRESATAPTLSTVRSTEPEYNLPSPPSTRLFTVTGLPSTAIGPWSRNVRGHDLSALKIWTYSYYNNTSLTPHDEWTYEERHRPHSLFPFLEIGPLSASADRSYLESSHVTGIVSIRWNPKRDMSVDWGTSTTGLAVARSLNLFTRVFEVRDLQDFAAQLGTIIEAIAAHLAGGLAKMSEAERTQRLQEAHKKELRDEAARIKNPSGPDGIRDDIGSKPYAPTNFDSTGPDDEEVSEHFRSNSATWDHGNMADNAPVPEDKSYIQLLRQQRQEREALPQPPHKLLIVCESGNQQSAATAAAFIMDALPSMDALCAMHWVQSRRFSANFSDEIRLWLQSFGDIVKARRAARLSNEIPMGDTHEDGSSGGNHLLRVDRNSTPASSKGKRALSDIGTDDEEMGDDDRDRFIERSPFVPFQDIDDEMAL